MKLILLIAMLVVCAACAAPQEHPGAFVPGTVGTPSTVVTDTMSESSTVVTDTPRIDALDAANEYDNLTSKALDKYADDDVEAAVAAESAAADLIESYAKEHTMDAIESELASMSKVISAQIQKNGEASDDARAKVAFLGKVRNMQVAAENKRREQNEERAREAVSSILEEYKRGHVEYRNELRAWIKQHEEECATARDLRRGYRTAIWITNNAGNYQKHGNAPQRFYGISPSDREGAVKLLGKEWYVVAKSLHEESISEERYPLVYKDYSRARVTEEEIPRLLAELKEREPWLEEERAVLTRPLKEGLAKYRKVADECDTKQDALPEIEREINRAHFRDAISDLRISIFDALQSDREGAIDAAREAYMVDGDIDAAIEAIENH